jgi:hypothetical protein
MKKIICISVLLFLMVTINNNIYAQTNSNYDSALAKKLNADDYGMKQYVLVILKKGTANITDKKVLDSIFHGHMTNIKSLASENKLVRAGTIGDNDKNYVGIFVFITGDINEAKQWLSTDPAIQSRDLDAEVYGWYGSAALQEIPRIHQNIQKVSF